MERIRERLQIAGQALATLDELVGAAEVSAVIRDASIQRFEYSFEAVWKASQLYLREMEGVEQASPKGVIRASFQVGLLDEGQAALALHMTDQRNLTAHTYNQDLAAAIHSQLPAFARLMAAWLKAINSRTV